MDVCQWRAWCRRTGFVRLVLPALLRNSKDPRDSLSRCKNEMTVCFRRNCCSSRNASIGKFVVQWWLHSNLKPFQAFRTGAVEIPGGLRVKLVRRCVAYKNFPILEIRTVVEMGSSGHLWDKASSKTLKATVCLDFILLQSVFNCTAGRPGHSSHLPMTGRSSNLDKI